MNKVYLIGNLTRDPEASATAGGVSFCRISIAVNRRFANADGSREVDYFNVTAWRGLADNCSKYLKKENKTSNFFECVINGKIITQKEDIWN